MAAEIRTFTCLSDNFGYLIHDVATKATASIDAPEAGPIIKALEREGWTLTDILITHHHHDHVGGVAELKQKYGCRVVAPNDKSTKIANVDLRVAHGDVIKVGSLLTRVLETPGHTLDHISFDVRDQEFVSIRRELAASRVAHHQEEPERRQNRGGDAPRRLLRPATISMVPARARIPSDQDADQLAEHGRAAAREDTRQARKPRARLPLGIESEQGDPRRDQLAGRARWMPCGAPGCRSTRAAARALPPADRARRPERG